MDPAAFYAMHFDGTVRRKPSGTWTAQAIVSNVVDTFATKHKVYIDIRNENGNSYNFYGNYKGRRRSPTSGKNIRFGTDASQPDRRQRTARRAGRSTSSACRTPRPTRRIRS